jgi:hypothetical protein
VLSSPDDVFMVVEVLQEHNFTEGALHSRAGQAECQKVCEVQQSPDSYCNEECCLQQVLLLTTSAPAVLAHLSVCCVLEGIKNLLQGH